MERSTRRGRWVWVLAAAVVLTAMLACSGGSGGEEAQTVAPAQPTSETLKRPTATTEPTAEATAGGFQGQAEAGEAYTDYVAVTDDLGAIQMEIPSAWSEVDGAPETLDNADFASIWAAPSLEQFQKSWGTPGVKFYVTAEKEKLGGHIQVLDVTRSWDFLGDCKLDSRYDYDDGYYRGAYDYYEKCGGTTDYMVLSAVPKQGGEDILILLEVQITSNADLEAAERILATFDIVGTLP